jgi:tetratricopeptide (TPR) repeat protein
VKRRIIFYLTALILCFGLLTAQDEDLELLGAEEEETVETGSCIPEDLSTIYDRFESDSVSEMDIKIFYNYGHEYHKNQNFDSAMPFLWNVFIHDSGKYAQAAIKRITSAYFDMEMADSTLIAAYRGLEKFPDFIILHYYAGLLQNSTGRSECALPHYQALAADEPENITYLSKLAELYYNLDSLDQAIEYQQKVFDLDPTNTEASERLSSLLVERDGPGADLDQKKETWEKDPNDMDKALDYGTTAYGSGEYNQALGPLTAVILSGSQKQKKSAYETRTKCYESLDQNRNAINDYKKILDLEPDNALTMCNTGSCYRRLKEFDNGMYWVNRALKTKSGFGLAYITLGEIYEDIVMHCQAKENRPRKPDDGLVYLKAYEAYTRAAKDPQFSALAQKRMRSVKPYLQTKEEIFMTEGRTEILNPCLKALVK